jgi:transglutaminase-like putative cysteine protease
VGWPKHKYGWIVLGGFGGPIRDNGCGGFCESGFAEVFLDRKAAEWVRRDERAGYARLAETYAHDPARKQAWLRHYAAVRIIRIALPGTYPQFQVPGRLERELQKIKRAG